MADKAKESTADSNQEHEKVSTSAPPATLRENQSSATHAKSHAAHLDVDKGAPRTKPAGDLHQGSYPTGRKQP